MIPVFKVDLPKGEALLLTATIGGATTNPTHPNQTDVYTDTFPEGLTIKMPIDEFFDLWMTCYNTELEEVNAIVFTPDKDLDFH